MTLLSASRVTISDEAVSRAVSITEYEQRKIDQRCTRCGVELPEDSTDRLCDEHLEAQRRYDRESKARLREERREAGQCADCGLPSETYRCDACLIRQDRVPRAGVQNGVDKAARIAARIIPWENSPQNVGRERMRGGERGRRSIAEENRSDFDLTEQELAAFVVKICGSVEAARRGEAHVWSDAVQGQPPIQRKAAVMAVLDHAHVAYRLLGEILRRGKHPCAPEPDE